MSKLVEYSSSESEDESRSKPAAAVASTMKLPMLLKVESSVSRRDSPSDHQNRTRQIPHVEGNWATHVFIDCKLAMILQYEVNSMFVNIFKIHWLNNSQECWSRSAKNFQT